MTLACLDRKGTKTDMSIEIPMRFEAEPLLWLVDDIYTEAECQNFIASIERSSPTLATNNPLYRNQDRVIMDDSEIAQDLFCRLRPHLAEQINGLKLVGLNERLRMYRYRSGQRFEPHMDHWYRPNETCISLHSVLVYFNDDFEGGETRFQEQIEQTITPKRGMVAIFQHKLRHEGCPVHRGTKYAMRTDIIYEALDSISTVG
jgi:prolyl 4-hydroxylase